MGKSFILCVMIFFFAFSADAKENFISNKEIRKILVFSNMVDLNKLDTTIEKKLVIRVFEVPVSEENDCFPESHGVCAYDYYISASQFDEQPEYNVFKIGTFGQITKYIWKKTSKLDTAEIEIFTTRYSLAAQKYNIKLPKIENRILLSIDVNRLIVDPL